MACTLTGIPGFELTRSEELLSAYRPKLTDLLTRLMGRKEAAAFLRSEVAKVCAQVLADAGVYKQDEKGLAGIKRFMATVGYQG